jgi:chorismate synthase
MAGNIFGTTLTVTTFGESHGPAVGCVIDGCPAGLRISKTDIDAELAKRRPGGGGAASPRSEPDECEILSGIFEGRTLGTPIAIIIRNTNQKSGDYAHLKNIYRPGHADKTWQDKYGLRDYRGGGRASGRETAARVAAGAMAKRLLAENGIRITAWVSSIGGIEAPPFGAAGFSLEEAAANPFRLPSAEAAAGAAALIDQMRQAGDSVGGTVDCRATGLPAGLGEPVFGKLDAALAAAMLSIGAAKGFEIGAGFAAAARTGSQNNDSFDEAGSAGGVLGGISTGGGLQFRVAFKPTPSISKKQQAFDSEGRRQTISIQGRHDVCICPRAAAVVEAMCALVLAGLLLENRLSRLQV